MRDAKWLIDQLTQQGVTQFCIAPGSRSTPLVQAAAEHPKAKTVVHFDERGLAFYALGFGKGRRKPAALITTSGTAAANLLPAVMEAYHSKTPLILLTSDRPPELRDCGANQTADQVKLFANGIRWQTDLSPDLDEKTIRSIAAHAVFQSLGLPPGPVHINCSFREPLYTPAAPCVQGSPISFSLPHLVADPIRIQASKGVLLIGQVEDPQPILQLAQRLRWPVFADLLSNARSTPTAEQILHFDYLIRSPSALKPDFLLHFGERFIAKSIVEWEREVPFFHVSPHPFLQDPSRRLSSRIQADIAPFCETFQAFQGEGWLEAWQAKDREIDRALESQFASSPFTEAHLYRSLPDDRPLFLGNGLPIRDADHFFFPRKGARFFCNRGLSGIDGNIATAAGLSDSYKTPLIAVIGDQAALHDLNSLPLLKNRPVLLVISNNFGGGIFEHLPVSQSPFFETHFAAAHSWNFEGAAKMFDLPYQRLEEAPSSWPLSGVVEILTDRKKNHRFQQNLMETCSLALA